MDKVYVLTAESGSWDDHQRHILDIYKDEETANLDKIRLEEEMHKIRWKYTNADIERMEDEIDNYLDENPPFDNDKSEMPPHLKEFQNWLYHTTKMYNHTVTEYTLK